MKYLPLLLIVVLLYSCGNPKSEKERIPVDTSVQHLPSTPVKTGGLSEQDSIKATGRQVLVLLKQKNYQELIKYFSSEGVLFSPYGYIDTAKSKKLNPQSFLEAINKQWVLTWGSADGTGDPIKLTVKAYLQRFVYDADYLNAEAIGCDEVLKKGNSAINLKEIYPKHHFIEYHFSGFEQAQKGMDWKSLRLVFEKQEGQYFLVAIVHDQWTI